MFRMQYVMMLTATSMIQVSVMADNMLFILVFLVPASKIRYLCPDCAIIVVGVE